MQKKLNLEELIKSAFRNFPRRAEQTSYLNTRSQQTSRAKIIENDVKMATNLTESSKFLDELECVFFQNFYTSTGEREMSNF